MGFLDIFRMGKVLVGTARSVRDQRALGRQISALPMPEFVAECMRHLNAVSGAWEGRVRPPDAQAAAIAERKRLPAELRDFYLACDGFERVKDEMPAAILPVSALKLGADHTPPLSRRLASYWERDGNESEQPGMLSVLPPDDLFAIAAHAAEGHLRPALLDMALPLCEPEEDRFVVILLVDAGKGFPAGTVLDVEAGSATRYPGFKAWLGTTASLFGSIAQRAGAAGEGAS